MGKESLSNGPCHMTKMAATPISCTSRFEILFSITIMPMTLVLGVEFPNTMYRQTTHGPLRCL